MRWGALRNGFKPRQLSFEHTESLRRLSRQVLTRLELRRRLIEHDQTIKELDQARIAAGARREAPRLKKSKSPSLTHRGHSVVEGTALEPRGEY
jgi:hypothetical protein